MTEDDFLKKDFFISDYVLLGTDIEHIKENKEKLTNKEKKVWQEVYSFAHMVNKSGRPYEDADVRNLCEQFYLSYDKVEGVFKKVFDENKDEYGINDKPEIYKVEVWLKKNWDFAENEITQVAEFRPKGSQDYETLNADTIYRKMQHVGFKFPLDKLKSLLRSDFMYRYNPFHDYFNLLPAWDGVTDHIKELASYIKVEDQDYFETQFKKCLVRCIGCSLYGHENRIVFVFVGEKQSTGKSTFLRFLNPFGTKYYTEAPIHNNKDSTIALAENFIYNLEELASLSNVEVNRMKSVISTATIKERKAYAVNPIEQPRRANFFGSTNKTEFLTDTENTRWLCFNVLSIGWGYKKKVDIDKVWAQAFALYGSDDFDAQLSEEETRLRDLKNKDYEINDYEKELIKRHFAVCSKDEGTFFSVVDIITVLEIEGGKKIESRFIGKNMIQLGFIRHRKTINGHKVIGYYVKKQIADYHETDTKTEKKPF